VSSQRTSVVRNGIDRDVRGIRGIGNRVHLARRRRLDRRNPDL